MPHILFLFLAGAMTSEPYPTKLACTTAAKAIERMAPQPTRNFFYVCINAKTGVPAE